MLGTFADDKSLLRIVTCGSVDDGKSTLMGRMLYDCRAIPDDHLTALERDSACVGTVPGGLDFALLLDGLQAEREQGITIDVVYRHFATPRRRFVVADTPGHEQYTRNMATGASTADIAILLIDARKRLLRQTLRHSHVIRLVGVQRVIVAVNKMDLVDFDETVFREIERDYADFAAAIDLPHAQCIPLSALQGDNVVHPSPRMPWYTGGTLLTLLEEVPVAQQKDDGVFRLKVQYVNRPNSDFRGYCGTVISGRVTAGDLLRVYPDGHEVRVARVLSAAANGEDVPSAGAGQSVTLTMATEVDIRRGHILAAADDAELQVADQFSAHLIGLGERPLVPGRPYLLQMGSTIVGARITDIKYQIDMNTRVHQAAKILNMNEVAACNLALDRGAAFLPFAAGHALGAFILVDRETNDTVAAGTIDFALRRATNVTWQPTTLDKGSRARLLAQKPCVVWLTGLSGAGKSAIADALEQKLHALGRASFILDGDNLRHGINRDLGFTEADRVENVRRVAEIAKLFVEAGLIVIVSLISPFRSERRMVRELVVLDEFLEIYVDTPLEDCERRDAKGLYRKARAGLLPNFTGIGSPYEPPKAPELVIDTTDTSPEQAAALIIERLIVKEG